MTRLLGPCKNVDKNIKVAEPPPPRPRLQQRSPGWSLWRRREFRSVASQPYEGVKPKPRFPRRGHWNELQPKKILILGQKGSPEMQVHPSVPRSLVSCLPSRRCHLRLRHHIPFRASKERGKFFLFWVSRAPGCGWKGAAAAQRSPNGDLPPPHPLIFCHGFGERLDVAKIKGLATCKLPSWLLNLSSSAS